MKDAIIIDETKRILTNYFQLRFLDGIEISMFAVDITPNIDTSKLNPEEQEILRKLIFRCARNRDSVLNKLKIPFFSLNQQFFTPNSLVEDYYDLGDIEFMDQIYKLKIKKVSTCEQTSKEAKQILGSLLKKDCLQRYLKLERIGRKYFDPSKKVDFPKRGLSLIQGYVTSLQIQSEKVLLQIDSCIKTVRTESYLEFLTQLRNNNQNLEQVNGGTVMTAYSKKFYRICQIRTDMNPTDTFESNRKEEKKYTYMEYYAKYYNIQIQNYNQPMIESQIKNRGKDITVFLVPELCFPTGETDEMRTDFHLQKELSNVKHCSALDKIKQSQSFKQHLVDDCKRTFENWNLVLNDKPLSIDFKQIVAGELIMKDKVIPIGQSNLDKETQSEMLVKPFDITKCQILHTQRGEQNLRKFVDHLQAACQEMNFPILNQPRCTLIHNEHSKDSWINSINNEAELVICILPGPKKKGKHYDDIKRYLTNELAIPSQVVLDITLKSDKGLRSVINKIVQQIGVKTQGVPYTISGIPESFNKFPTMICGIDIYHQSKTGKQSVLAFVGTVDQNFGRYTSSTKLQDSEHDISTNLACIMDEAINQFGKHNHVAPSRIVIYRDGVSKGQTDTVLDLEIPAIKDVLEKYNDKTFDKQPIKISFIVVNKRVNAKFYVAQSDNIESCKSADSGCLIDKDIVDDYKDYYIVSQQAKQGVATPTHYRMIYDDDNFEIMEEYKILTYKLCYLYFNMTGAIKIPAPTKYAHLLSNFVGDSYDYRRPNTLISAHQKFKQLSVLYFI